MLSIIVKNLPQSCFTGEADQDKKTNRLHAAQKAFLVDTVVLLAGAIFGILCLLKVIPLSPSAAWAITIPFGFGAAYAIKLNFDSVAKPEVSKK